MAFIAKHMIAECRQDVAVNSIAWGHTSQYNYLSLRCKRNTLYKNTKNPNTPLAKRPRRNTCLPLIAEHRCRFRFGGFVFRDGKWRFSIGSGIYIHVFHVRQVNGVTARDDLWEKVCSACDDSFHATAVMQQLLITIDSSHSSLSQGS
jgi:hypothetical protein